MEIDYMEIDYMEIDYMENRIYISIETLAIIMAQFRPGSYFLSEADISADLLYLSKNTKRYRLRRKLLNKLLIYKALKVKL